MNPADVFMLVPVDSSATTPPDHGDDARRRQPTGTLAAWVAARAGVAVLAVVAAACGDGSADVETYRDPRAPVEARVADLLGRMTLTDKVAQMHGLQIDPIQGLYHTADDDRLDIPGLRMCDGPRGVSGRTGRATAFPVAAARAATFDPELEAEVGRAIGREARARGANVLLAPTINLLRAPQWGRAQETYGEDPFLLGEMGAAFVRGAQEMVVASVKHLAMNSIEDTRFYVNVEADERALREVYLPHFRKVVQAGVGSVMTAYNRVRGAYCAENAHLLRDILKGEWGFDGFVESDWIVGTRSTVASVLAGLDIEMPVAIHYGDRLVAAVESGEVPESVIDDAVGRILRVKFRFGIFDGLPPVDPAVIESAEHRALALEVERRAIVLLRNEGATLPLERASVRRIAVVGELADRANLGDFGSSFVDPTNPVTPLAGIRARAGRVEVIGIATDAPSASQLEEIENADAAVVVVGLDALDEGERLSGTGGDREELDLAAEQVQLVLDVARRQPRTIVVIEGSGAVLVEPFVEHVGAIVLAFYPGVEGGNAIADVLFGDVVPSGKLPVTFARSADELPPFDNAASVVVYDADPGYRFVDRHGFEPRYPFGFGLSYTTFAVTALGVERVGSAADGAIRARVEVANTGARAGDEVVQLYVSYPRSVVSRPVRELKAFRRVSLARGETTTIELVVPLAELAYWDVTTGGWVVEPATYRLEVGTSSRDLPLVADLQFGRPDPPR
jgi:beta-glucosidase